MYVCAYVDLKYFTICKNNLTRNKKNFIISASRCTYMYTVEIHKEVKVNGSNS